MTSQLTIVGAPPTWFDSHPLPANTHIVQPVEPDPLPGESIAGVLDDEDRRPLVYVTFGTAFNTPDLFQMVFDAVADLDIRAVATIGMSTDAPDLEVPRNVRTGRSSPRASSSTTLTSWWPTAATAPSPGPFDVACPC